jgi:hypothetical protein
MPIIGHSAGSTHYGTIGSACACLFRRRTTPSWRCWVCPTPIFFNQPPVAYGFSSEFIEYVRDVPVKPAAEPFSDVPCSKVRSSHSRCTGRPDYNWPEAQRLGGFRTALGVPMLREAFRSAFCPWRCSEVRPSAVHALQRFLRLFSAEARRVFDHHFGQSDDGIERRAQLVADAHDANIG